MTVTEYFRSPNENTSYFRHPDVWSNPGSSWSLVSERFDLTSAYAASSYNLTADYVDQVLALVKNMETFDIPDIDVSIPDIPELDVTTRPRFSLPVIDGTFPDNTAVKPILAEYEDFTPVTMPVLRFIPPDFSTPTKPDQNAVTPPGEAPNLDPVVIPPKPSITLPTPPVFDDITLPPPPSITLPTFDAGLPDEILATPAEFNWSESPFNSDIWTDLLDKTLDGIVNGGTGLNPDVEQAIYDRARARLQLEHDSKRRGIESDFAARGFPLPGGVLVGRIDEHDAEITRNNLELSEKVMIDQAELAQKNTHFVMQLGLDAEKVLRDFHESQMNRSLDAAKALAASSVEIFNALISKYNAKIDSYKAQAVVYSEQIKAALTEVEIFKGQIESAQVSAEVQKTLADVYEKQLMAVETTIKLYTAEMDGAKVASEIQASRLEVFRLQIQAYVAQLDAEKTKFEIYGVEVEAEKSKAALYSEQVRSYVAEVDAERSKADIQIAQTDAVTKKNVALIEEYKAELSAYGVEVDAAARKIGAQVDGFKAEATAYSAETEAKGMEYGARVKEIEARIEFGKFNLQKALAEIEAATNGYIKIKEQQLKGTESVMNVNAQLAASAMNAVNASASYGYSGSESKSVGFSYGSSMSETHSFNETPGA